MSDRSVRALEKYSRALDERDEHIEQNKQIFSHHESIVGKIIDAENELRDAVDEAKEGLSDGLFTITYVPQSQTIADIEAIDALIQNGSIDAKYRDQIVKTFARSAKISISKSRA